MTPIKTVVKPLSENENFEVKNKAYTDDGILINSNELNGMKAPKESIPNTIDILEKKIGKRKLILD